MPHAASILVSVVVAALLVAVQTAAPSDAAPAITGDDTAWHEITAAYQKLEGRSYRMRTTAPGQVVITEHVPPDSTRVTTSFPGQTGGTEVVRVGAQSRARIIGPEGPGPWFCGQAEPQALGLELMKFITAVYVARRPDTVVESEVVHVYDLTYAIQGHSPRTVSTLYVGVNSGLPRHSVTSYPLGPGEVVIDYYDYGAAITIMLPACP